jgi:hypothetical protein
MVGSTILSQMVVDFDYIWGTEDLISLCKKCAGVSQFWSLCWAGQVNGDTEIFETDEAWGKFQTVCTET